jgi:hypothetical protein
MGRVRVVRSSPVHARPKRVTCPLCVPHAFGGSYTVDVSARGEVGGQGSGTRKKGLGAGDSVVGHRKPAPALDTGVGHPGKMDARASLDRIRRGRRLPAINVTVHGDCPLGL